MHNDVAESGSVDEPQPCCCNLSMPQDFEPAEDCPTHGDTRVLEKDTVPYPSKENPLIQITPRNPEGYIYINDTATWSIYCGRCGRQPFGDFARREPAGRWAERVAEHVACTRENPGGGKED